MITVRHLTKYFDGKPAISDISTQYSPGECSLVIGASGSGKTVLLKSIIGLLDPDEGEVLFGDVVFNKLPLKEKKATRSQIGMLFQGSALFDFATAQENVMFPLNFFSDMSKSEKLDRANFCLKRVGLENVNDKYPSELSGGMQKRVGIARAIALNPKYLFCDEPNSGLDPQTSVMIDRLIQEITQEYGITTIINTHDMNSVMEIGDKVLFIYKGRKLWEGANKDILLSDCKELEELRGSFRFHVYRCPYNTFGTTRLVREDKLRPYLQILDNKLRKQAFGSGFRNGNQPCIRQLFLGFLSRGFVRERSGNRCESRIQYIEICV